MPIMSLWRHLNYLKIVMKKSQFAKKISECVLKVTDSPLKMMEVAFKALELSEFLLGLGNKNADSDLLVGLMLLEVAIKGAYQNVKINLGGLDQEKRDYYVSKSV